MKFIAPEDCTCYKCVGPDYGYTDDGRKYITNNMEHHTFGEPCSDCGREKTEYRDLGRKGRYICWWCTDRSVVPGQMTKGNQQQAVL